MEKAKFSKFLTGGIAAFVIFCFGCVQLGFSVNAAEDDKPLVVSSTPNNMAYNVPLDQNMTIIFNMDLDLTTVIKGNITVNGGTDLISNIETVIDNPQKITIGFKNLENFKSYAVNLKNIKNTSGISIDENTITFVTKEVGGEVLINYDMESDDPPNGAAGMINAGNYYTTAVKHSGNRALILNFVADWAKAGWYRHDAMYKPGTTFKISFWAKTENVSEIRVGLNVDNVIGIIKNITPGADFVECSFLYSMPLNFEGDCLLYFAVPGSGIIYIDDFKVELAGETKFLPISTPYDKAENVPVNSTLSYMFNYNIDASTATTANIKINDGEVLISNVVASENRIILLLAKGIEYDKKYQVSFNIKDEIGRSFSAIRTFTAENKYDIGGLDIYKDYNSQNQLKLTNKVLQSGSISAVASGLNNNSNTDGSVILVIALYKDNYMIDAQYSNIEIPANTILTAPLVASMNVPSLSNGEYYLRAYVWDDLAKIQSIGRIKITE